MDDFLRILHIHAKRYWQMTPQDAVKLAYQSVFGGGHMISDEVAALTRLQSEYAALREKTTTPDGNIPLTEPIGGGLVRLHLAALDPSVLPLTAVNALFCRSAQMVQGSVETFQQVLNELRQGCQDGYLPFALDELEVYLQTYIAAGTPMVSHSETYRAAYHPAYRIIRQEFVPYLAPIGAIYRCLAKKGRVVVAIDGMAGAGKSTLATLLAELTKGDVISMDDFFLPAEKRTAQRLSEAGGNVDYERFATEVLSGLKQGKELTYGVFDCSQMAITATHTVPEAPVRIVEGSYAMHPYFGSYADVTVFLHISPTEQMQRITERNGTKMAEKFRNIWIPMENRYFREKHVAERCRYVIRSEI